MNQALQAFRAVDFNWTRDLQSVWSDPVFQVDALHKSTIDGMMDDFLRFTRRPSDNPIGQVILGEAGVGKTHMIGTLRRRTWQAGGWFVLLDIIGITDFWQTAALGFVSSLHQPMANGQTQYQALLSATLNVIAKQASFDQATRTAIREWQDKPNKTRLDTIDLFLKLLRRLDRAGAAQHQDVIRAVLLLDSDDFDASNLAYCWLQGLNVDDDRRCLLKFSGPPPSHDKLVGGMLWVMGLAGPTLIAVDQIDSIISESNLLAGVEEARSDDSERRARHIIEALAGGLMALHDLKRRAMTVVSCLEGTWPVIETKAVKSAAQRFKALPALERIGGEDIVENLIFGRLSDAYVEAGFHPPYRTWPFQPGAIHSAVGLSPREILMRCDEHRRHCIEADEVVECRSLAHDVVTPPPESPPSRGMDEEFERRRNAADISLFLDEKNEDAATSELLIGACELFLKQVDLPPTIDAVVRPDPDAKKPSLHARISFTFHNEGDREQHYCFRFLGHANAIAFQSRLKAAMTASGIDRALKFRRLFILRRDAPPKGDKTKELVDQFAAAGGQFVAPTHEDLRAFAALRTMAEQDLPNFEAWLRERKPLFDTALFKAAGLCPPPFLAAAPSAARQEGARAPDADGQRSTPEPVGAASRVIPIGRRFEHGGLGDPVALPANLLPRHVAILAGSGSGKTVLLRRIVEEAALIDIPAVVLDVNNDLARLGDPWPTRPDEFDADDAAKADAYAARVDVVVWTPGLASGNPLALSLLPDFAAIGDRRDDWTEDERGQAVEMARATLAPYLSGAGQRAQLKQGVLADALRAFARAGGGQLADLVDLLSEFPATASAIGGAPKLAGEVADQLRAAIATNPLLQSAGESLDPQRLFRGGDGRTRISVVNLAGLASDEARESFVNQLQMALFTWIKQNPSPTGRLYALDEAQNFAPSLRSTACKASALALAAQARKYGLGMIFATQLPKGIDHAIVTNCTTQVYGRMSSPATIQATHELMAAKGGAAEDIARLSRGEFYFTTEGLDRPVKLRAALCLSWHPPNPPTADEVAQKARAKRR